MGTRLRYVEMHERLCCLLRVEPGRLAVFDGHSHATTHRERSYRATATATANTSLGAPLHDAARCTRGAYGDGEVERMWVTHKIRGGGREERRAVGRLDTTGAAPHSVAACGAKQREAQHKGTSK